MPEEPRRKRLLLADDDQMILQFVGEVLRQHYDVETAATAGDALDCLTSRRIDLLLLDLTLPDEDGLVLLRKLQMHNRMPVIVISGRADDDNRIAALEMGARDYLVKPFNPRELILRIDNCLNHMHSTATLSAPESIEFGNWSLNYKRRTLLWCDSHEQSLTRAEFDLLSAMASARGDVVSRNLLMDAITTDSQGASDSSLTVLIHRLRKKLAEKEPDNEVILTVSGVGYRLAF